MARRMSKEQPGPSRRVLRRARWTVLLAAIALALLALDRLFPPPIPDLAREGSTLVLARDGSPLRAFAGADGVWRYPVRVDAVSPLYLEALIGFEDRRFRQHPGVDPLALLRAAWQAARHGGIVSGGSTLTMQVARLVDPVPRTASGKLRQIVRALQLEWRLSKDQILDLYLALAPFGGNVEGVEAASWAYLGKSARQLSHAEAALLAALPQAPSRLRPDRHPRAARDARDKVLARLARFGAWSPDRLREAALEPVVARRLQPPLRAALLAERLFQRDRGARLIRSTLDAATQSMAERRVAAHVSTLPPRTSAAALVIDNDTLEARAYVGSALFADPARLGHVDMVAATRSPGSTLKPFLYGLALDDGLIHSESLLVDAPRDFDGYRPANFGDRFNGPVGAADALRLSLNVPAVDLLAHVGPARFAARLRHAGVALQFPRAAAPNLALILGGTGATLEQLAGAYAALARGGLAGSVRLRDDEARRERRLLSPGAAWIVRTILEAPGRPGEPAYGIDRGHRARVAWKTGTSYGHRDAWAFGVTARHTVGVWVGRPDGTPMPGQYGAGTALPLLFALVDALPRGATDASQAPMPASVASATVCWPLGTAFEPAHPELCARRREAWTLDARIPPTLVDRAHAGSHALRSRMLVDPRDGRRVAPGCAPPDAQSRLHARWPVLATPWLDAHERTAAQWPPPAAACLRDAPANDGSLRITGVHAGARVRQAPGSTRAPLLELHALGASGEVAWLVNGRLAGRGAAASPLRWRIGAPGGVTVVALDDRGRYDRVAFEVLP